jgi:hypothetical protein
MMDFKFSRLCTAALMLATATVAGVAGQAKAEGYSAWMYEGDSVTYDAYLLAGESVYAACDEDCLDLDLFLYDESGALVAVDDAVDAQPILTAPYEGNFTIEMAMPSCTTVEGCEASVSSSEGF